MEYSQIKIFAGKVLVTMSNGDICPASASPSKTLTFPSMWSESILNSERK